MTQSPPDPDKHMWGNGSSCFSVSRLMLDGYVASFLFVVDEK